MGSDHTGEQAAFKFEKLLLLEPCWQAQKVLFPYKKHVWQIRLFFAAKLDNVVTNNNNKPKFTSISPLKNVPAGPYIIFRFSLEIREFEMGKKKKSPYCSVAFKSISFFLFFKQYIKVFFKSHIEINC